MKNKGVGPQVISVPVLADEARLDVYLAGAAVVTSRSQAKVLIDNGCVLVDGRPCKAGFLLHGGERLEIRPPAKPPAGAAPENIPLRILYQDDDLLAVDKPAGMVVHPAPGNRTGTLVSALLHHDLVTEGATGERPGIVHRLDKETSGVLLVARTLRAHEALARAFRERTVHKRYLAVVLGTPSAKEGLLTWSIGRHPRERQRMSIHSHRGRTARTTYRVMESFRDLSLLELRPETGRTHQLRVHLAAMGHPVLADPLYGSRKGRALPKSGPGREFGRQALHAAEIELVHPTTGARLRLVAPYPEDLRVLLDRLRAKSASSS